MLVTVCRIAPCGGVLLFLIPIACRGDLVVDSNLGVLPLGTTNVTGDTAAGANNADYYFDSVNPEGNWGLEYVYQFQLAEVTLVGLTLNDTNGDPDLFLLGSLTTATAGTKNVAQDDLNSLFLDDPPPDSESLGLLPAGTYYLSIDAFSGFDPPPRLPASATYDLDITAIAVQPPASFFDLGTIAIADEPLTIDSFGSSFDTLLGMFDSDGFLLSVSDDADGGLQSQLNIATGLPPGEYYVALGGFDTNYLDGFVAQPEPGSEIGDYVLNFPGGSNNGILLADEAQWFRFEVSVPEPATWRLGAIGAILLLWTIARQPTPRSGYTGPTLRALIRSTTSGNG